MAQLHDYNLPSHIREYVLQREARSKYAPILPELPESSASEVYDQIEATEAAIASPSLSKEGYAASTAASDDELADDAGHNGVLLIGEHATDHLRNGKRKPFEAGLAGLIGTLHVETGSGILVMKGRQTGDANYDAHHPLKQALASRLANGSVLAVGSIHGLANGKVKHVTDKTTLAAVVGIGKIPSPENDDMAHKLAGYAAELGLDVGVNTAMLRMSTNDQSICRLDSDNRPATISFLGGGQNTVRTHAEAHGSPIALQFELSQALRYQPQNKLTDRKRVQMGVYSGYLLLKKFIELGQAV